jgi:hypothetical protein
MNRRIIVTFSISIALLLLINPVVAGTKIQVVASTRSGGPIGGLPTTLEWNWWITEGGIIQTRDLGTYGFGEITIGSNEYSIVSTQYISQMIDTKSDKGVIHYRNVVWTLSDSQGIVGTFVGTINGKIRNQEYNPMILPPPLAHLGGFPKAMTGDYELHGVFKGSDVFEGKTMQLTGTKMKGDANDFIYVGFLFP